VSAGGSKCARKFLAIFLLDLLLPVPHNFAMAYGYGTDEGGYRYPSAEAEFNLYNFHSQQQADELANLLASKGEDSRIIQLFGKEGDGKCYLVRAAAYISTRRGVPVDVIEISLEGYEPDIPLKGLIEFLAARAKDAEEKKLKELAQRIKLEARLTSASFLFVALGIKTDFTIGELLQLFESDESTRGPELSKPKILSQVIEKLTQKHRLVLYISNANRVDSSLILRLVHLAELNAGLFVVFAYSPEERGTPLCHAEPFQLHLLPWTKGEMKRAFAERFQPSEVPADFLDGIWNSGLQGHTRQGFVRIILRIVRKSWLASDRSGTWTIDKRWYKNPQLLDEFTADLDEQIYEIEDDLQKSGVPGGQIRRLLDFLDLASLCDPTIPVHLLLQFMGIHADEKDAFIDWLDNSLRVEHEDGILESLNYSHPGFSSDELIYRFRSPLVAADRQRHFNIGRLGVKLFNFLSGRLRPDTRTIADLYLRLAESAGLEQEISQYGELLRYWSSVSETEGLAQIITAKLEAGELSAELLWRIIIYSKEFWPAARRLALIEAYGSQPDGVPIGNRFAFLIAKSWILHDLSRHEEALDFAEEALHGELPEPQWSSKLEIHLFLGDLERHLENYPKAINWLESAISLAKANLRPDDPDIARSLTALATVYYDQNKYSDAEPLYERGLMIREKTLGPDDPVVADSLIRLAGLYRELGKYPKAEMLSHRALEIRQKLLHPKHPDIARAVFNLAACYMGEGKDAEAEPLLQRSFVILEKFLGPQHSDVTTMLERLALCYRNQKKYEAAEALLQQALVISEKISGLESARVASNMNSLAMLFFEQGRYEEGERLHRRALRILEAGTEVDLSSLEVVLHNLATQVSNQGKYAEAISLYERSIAIQEKIFNSEHPGLGSTLSNLGGVYQHQGKYTEAEELYQRALKIKERTLSSQHPDIVKALSNLAQLYNEQRKYREAESLYERVLKIQEKELGLEHPDVVATLNNLALLCYEQGRYREAEPLYMRVLKIQEKELGLEHPDVATTLNILAILYDEQGRYREAKSLYERALKIREKELDSEHPDIAASLHNLATLYHEHGKYQEAITLYQRALNIRGTIQGPEHADVAASLYWMAMLYCELGRYAEAEESGQRALNIREKLWDYEHPEVAKSLHAMATLYYEEEKYIDAEVLSQRAFEIRRKALDSNHPAFAVSLNLQALLHYRQGKYGEAEALSQQALSIQELRLGLEHPDVAASLNTQALIYYKQGKYMEAEALCERARTIQETTLGSNHPALATSLNTQALLCYALGKYTEAELLCRRSVEIRDQVLGTEHPRTREARKNLDRILSKS
jgi:tetratricopeptide (TPR) repeat protein